MPPPNLDVSKNNCIFAAHLELVVPMYLTRKTILIDLLQHSKSKKAALLSFSFLFNSPAFIL